ncbi:LLM class F420-dependent oxidoreductase [Pseudonocardia ailaonensis]|uniref:LLM class F420-dependent oxidoreductase n=1 Tax=Pseudonocardia ailaonensis TaxID=367279 RepID=A0ABN2NFH4_9PSEU
MRIGVVFPQNEITASGAAARRFAREVEELGFAHVLAYDHVLGADPAAHPGWSGPYDVDTEFHEPLVLFAHLAAVCELELVTGVLVLPQRQAALVAKQAATLSLLAEGRVRLGVGTGWNEVEYAALGMPFADRGDRMDEQVAMMRRLWAERSITDTGDHHVVDGAGIAPRPAVPVPLWFGTYGRARRPLERIGRLGDGWLPVGLRPGPELDRATAQVATAAAAAGRDPARIGLEGRVRLAPGRAGEARDRIGAWTAAGATHLTVDTRGNGLRDGGHTDLLHELAQVLDEKETSP